MTVSGTDGLSVAERAVVAAALALEAACDELCWLDSVAGDGNHGLTMATAAKSIRAAISDRPPADLAALLATSAEKLAAVGGAMGALSYVLVQAVGEAVAGRVGQFSALEIARLLAVAEDSVSAFGGAQRGDKTIVDAIAGARDAAEETSRLGRSVTETLLAAAEGARKGAESTAELVARIGRASRLGERSKGTVDAGARSFAIALGALADTYAGEAESARSQRQGQ